MNIHCSACGAPLPQGAKVCPACALPLTAIAMPAPAAPRKKPVSMLAVFAAAFFILWAVAYAADRQQIRSTHAAVTSPAAEAQANWDRTEQRVEQHSWFHADRLRVRRAQVAEELAKAKGAADAPAIAGCQVALARIDARLRELHAR
jgi:predicted amidophosphoribosyltransferase